MASAQPLASFSTHGLPPADRYDAWRTLISAVFEPSFPDMRAPKNLNARARALNLGDVLLVDAAADAQGFVRSKRLIAAEGLDHYLVQVYRRGVCDGAYGEIRNTVRPGDIKIIDLGQPFHTFNTDFENISLTIPRATLAPLLARPDGLHGLVLPGETPLAAILAAHLRTLSDTGPVLGEADREALAAGTVQLVAACLGAAPRAREHIAAARAAAVGQAIRDFIDRHIGSPLLGPEMLAREFGISRARLYRLFEDEDGIVSYIQARRLRHCLATLTDPGQAHRRQGEIAFAAGFASDAHFSRAFRRAFGMSPSEARGRADLAFAPRHETFINDWMRDLRPRANGADPR